MAQLSLQGHPRPVRVGCGLRHPSSEQPAVPMPEKPGLMQRIKSWPCTRARVEGLTVGFILGISTALQIAYNVPR